MHDVNLFARKKAFSKSCENKEQFFTEKECYLRISAIQKKFGGSGLVPYKCDFCGWWHYGHEIGYEKKIESVEGGTG